MGVQQGDFSRQNVLWNNELDRAILIDFEFGHVEAHKMFDIEIAEETEVKESIKILGATSRNRASHWRQKRPSVSNFPNVISTQSSQVRLLHAFLRILLPYNVREAHLGELKWLKEYGWNLFVLNIAKS